MSPTQQPTATAWPEGVIARYVTVGGGNVDVTLLDSEVGVVATCPTHPEPETRESYFDYTADDRQIRTRAMQAVCDWAQAHASECRAVPKPEAGNQ